jgi:hypothetical protein
MEGKKRQSDKMKGDETIGNNTNNYIPNKPILIP